MNAARTAVVIGGGIAGPVTALALRRAGVEVELVEATHRDAQIGGAMLSLPPNGVDALRHVGAHTAVRELGQPLQNQVVSDETGRLIGVMPAVAGQPPSLGLWREDLHRVLRDRVAEEGIATRFNARLEGVVEEDGRVMARLSGGDDVTADVIVGADGIHSRLRSCIDPAAAGPRSVPLFNVGGASVGPARSEVGAAHFVFGRRAFFGYWAQSDGRTAWFANVPETQLTSGEDRGTQADAWLERLGEIFRDDVPAQDIVSRTDPSRFIAIGRLQSMPRVSRWWRGPMVLVGDAVHAPSPSSGQGAAMAIESGIELARCVRDHDNLRHAFSAYEGLRRARVESIIRRGDRTTSTKTGGPVAKAMMRAVMPLALRTILDPERTLGPEQRFRIDWERSAATAQALGARR